MTQTLAATPQIVAFMDIGTNSVRLLVVQFHASHSYSVLHQLKETVRLGENEFAHQHLQPEAIDRAVQVCRQFALVARSAGADEIVAVATAATREAENRQLFLRRLRLEADIDVHVVSGLEEARLVYLGVANGLHLEAKRALFVDIGGGSTEVIVGGQDDYQYLNSLKLGAIRLSGRFLTGVTGPVSLRLYEQIRAYIRNDAARTLQELRTHHVDLAVGSSGTIENLAEIAARMFFKRPLQREDMLSYFQIKETIAYLCSLGLEARRRVPGMNPARADIIIGGAAVIDVLLDELAISELRVSDRGLREGLLFDYQLRHAGGTLVAGQTVRERSVLQLGRTCRFNEPHARTTERLALMLFDSARASRLHRLGAWERELLSYAALLHHIGAFLTYNNYQKHTAYLIRNAELLGFDQTETEVMAATALYHRNALPRKKEPALAVLTSEQQAAVRMMSTFLRIAESLDRSQSGNVSSARLNADGGRTILLQIEAAEDPQVELWGLEGQLDKLEKVFGRPVRIETNVLDRVSA